MTKWQTPTQAGPVARPGAAAAPVASPANAQGSMPGPIAATAQPTSVVVDALLDSGKKG